MSINADITTDTKVELLTWPTHLNCPYCPAQSYPIYGDNALDGKLVRRFVCPASHIFYVNPERSCD